MEDPLAQVDGTLVTIVDTTITCAAWLHKMGEFVLAANMRDAFLQEWKVNDAIWDTRVEVLAEYAERQDSTIAANLFRDLIT